MSKRRNLSGPFLSLALIVILVGSICSAVFNASQSRSLSELQAGADQRLELYAAGLESELTRYARLPEILGLLPAVEGLLQKQGDRPLQLQANRYLALLTSHSGVRAIYILNSSGRVIATSNWHGADNYLGKNDEFRPYFQDAMRGRPSHFFGISTKSNEPGYYLSTPLYDGARPLGVVVVKISLAQLEQTWAASHALVWVSDANRVIILDSRPEWKFTTLGALSAGQAQRLDQSRQYNRLKLNPLNVTVLRQLNASARIVRWTAPGPARIARRYLAETRALPANGWQLTVLVSMEPAYNLAINRAALAGVLAALILTGVILWNERQRRLREKLAAREELQQAYRQLEQKVMLRTADLSAANIKLQDEVAERIRAEKHLHQTQTELLRAGKLAVIGQLSTQIAHELNQPLAALHTLSGNTVKYLARGDLQTSGANLDMIGQLVARMGKITGSLKSFARQSGAREDAAPLNRVVDHALALLAQRFSEHPVRVERNKYAEDLIAQCDPGRLEQVLVNLLANALDVLCDLPDACIDINCCARGGNVLLSVRDNGPGLTQDCLDHLFEPFFTTKPPGDGLGLGLVLSSSIIAAANGTLTAGNHPEGGAEFVVTLPLAPSLEPAFA